MNKWAFTDLKPVSFKDFAAKLNANIQKHYVKLQDKMKLFGNKDLTVLFQTSFTQHQYF